MNQKYILKRNEDVLLVVKTGIKKVYDHLIVYNKDNILNNSRFCISVSKKIGNAVVRNRLKRQIKDIIMKNMVTNNKDYVIILSSSFKELSFEEKKKEILKGIE